MALYQLDINDSFLYGDLSEHVYMNLPPAYYTKNDTRVWKLVKFLYGLKQTPRKWKEKLYSSLFKIRLRKSINDYSLFIKTCGVSITVLLVYVDDIILSGSHEDEINKVKDFLKT